MAEATPTPTPAAQKAKPKAAPSASVYEIPNFELPKFEVPAAFREFAEKGISQAKENYEKIKSAAEEATDVLEDTYANAAKGASDYSLKVVESARANTNAAFDLFGALVAAKSYSEAVELSSAYMRAQFDAFTAQAKDLAECAQKAATETAEPMKEGFTNAARKAA